MASAIDKMLDTQEDRALAERVVNGDRLAAEAFFDLYYPRVYRFCVVRLRDDSASEDIAQETMMTALKGLHTYRGDAALFSWLCSLCSHEISAWLKKNKKHEHLELEDSDELQRALDTAGSNSEPENRLVLNRLIHHALDSLPPDYSKVLELKYIEGQSVQEIATTMNSGQTAVQSLLARARTGFKNVFAELSADRLTVAQGEGSRT